MRNLIVSFRAAMLLAACLFVGVVPAKTNAQSQESDGEGQLSQSSEEISGITPQADRILLEMSEYLKKASEFTFHAELRYDTVRDNGQKIEFGAFVRVACRRPNRLHIEYRGDERNTRLVYDGRTFTRLDLDKNVYSVINVPDNIDAAVDHLFDKIGSSVPIADMVYADPYRILTEFVIHGSSVGLHKIDGRPCHHLAFAQEQVDWQIASGVTVCAAASSAAWLARRRNKTGDSLSRDHSRLSRVGHRGRMNVRCSEDAKYLYM